MNIAVIGANHAGTAAINTILDNYPNEKVTVFDQNNNISFLGCGMALWIGRQISGPGGLFYASADQFAQKGAAVYLETAVDAIDFGAPQNYDVTSAPVLNTPVQIKECPYFTTNVIQIHGMVERDFTRLDSFVIYICLGGELQVRGAEGSTSLVRGETTLVPAEEEEIVLEGQGTVLEVYIR